MPAILAAILVLADIGVFSPRFEDARLGTDAGPLAPVEIRAPRPHEVRCP